MLLAVLSTIREVIQQIASASTISVQPAKPPGGNFRGIRLTSTNWTNKFTRIEENPKTIVF